MAEIQIVKSVASDDCEGDERGERGERGRRGHRGHDGHDGHDGATGATGPTGPSGSSGVSPVIAAGAFVGTSVVNSRGFSAPTLGAPNQIDLILTSPPANINNVVVLATLLHPLSGGEITYSVTAPATVSILTWTSAGGPALFAFSVAVLDNT